MSTTNRRAVLSGVAAAALAGPAGAAAAIEPADPVHAAIERHRVADERHRVAVHAADYIGAPEHLYEASVRALEAEAAALRDLVMTSPATVAGLAVLFGYLDQIAHRDGYEYDWIFNCDDVPGKSLFGHWAAVIRQASAA